MMINLRDRIRHSKAVINKGTTLRNRHIVITSGNQRMLLKQGHWFKSLLKLLWRLFV